MEEGFKKYEPKPKHVKWALVEGEETIYWMGEDNLQYLHCTSKPSTIVEYNYPTVEEFLSDFQEGWKTKGTVLVVNGEIRVNKLVSYIRDMFPSVPKRPKGHHLDEIAGYSTLISNK